MNLNNIQSYFLVVIYFIYLPISTGQELEDGDRCVTKDSVNGKCRKIIDCPAANFEFEQKHYHTHQRCGFDEEMEIVCCLPDSYGDRFATDSLAKTTATSATTAVPETTATRPVAGYAAALPAAAAPAVTVATPKSTTATARDEGDFVFKQSEFDIMSTTAPSRRRADLECDKLISRVPPPLGSYIIGGQAVEMGEFPHMIAIGYKVINNDSLIDFKCGGSLITEEYVLTAAHCVVSRSRLKIDVPVLVRAGTITIQDPAKRDEIFDFEIDQIIPHPEYYRKINDIALVKLKRPVPLTSASHPVCLFTKEKVPSSGYITGWGITAFGNPVISEVLLKANVTTISKVQCREHYKTIHIRDLKDGISDQMICAGAGGKDACQGDSGGPLQAQTEADGHYRVFGITSFGVGCGSSIPGVYTRVSSYLDWIESVVWPEKS